MNITDTQFKTFRDLVYNECGINLHDGKKRLLSARLARRMRRTAIDSVDTYLDLISVDKEELVDFIDAISTNHTFFFRENGNFKYLTKSDKNIWCAASSSGEEPYSIAIYMMERFGVAPRILATDISTAMLAAGANGIYKNDRVDKLDMALLKKYFQKGKGKHDGSVRVKKNIRESVSFDRFNLLTDNADSEYYDIIFCRNVMIYFDIPVKERVVSMLYRPLKPGGYLVIGGAEGLSGVNHSYKYISPSVYQKV